MYYREIREKADSIVMFSVCLAIRRTESVRKSVQEIDGVSRNLLKFEDILSLSFFKTKILEITRAASNRLGVTMLRTRYTLF